MTHSTIIKDILCEPLNVELTEPFGISGGAQHIAHNVLVRVLLQDGTVGLGEAAPFESYNGETQASTIKAFSEIKKALIGCDSYEWRSVSEVIKGYIENAGAARCGVEMAILDALCRSKKIPLWSLFGEKKATIETDMTITTQSEFSEEESILHATNSTRDILKRGIKIIKTKVGRDIQKDIKRLVAIQSAAPQSPIILDGNGGYTATEALTLLEELKLKKVNIIVFEQPVHGDDIDGLSVVSQNSEVLIMADESVRDLASAKTLVERKAVHAVNIKTMKRGIVEAFDVSCFCKQSGLKLMIGGNVETILSMTTSACLSYGLGVFDFHDLDTPAWMKTSPFKGGFKQKGSMIEVSHIREGHGVEVG